MLPFETGKERSRATTSLLTGAATASVVLALVHLVTGRTSGVAAGTEDVLMVLSGVLQLASMIAFGTWLLRAYRNLSAFGPRARYVPGVAVAFFFLPFVSFFLPQAVLDELWSGSRSRDPRALSPLRDPEPPWFEGWWYAFLAFSAVTSYAFVHGDEPSSFLTLLLLTAALLAIATAAGGAVIIRRIDQRQQTAHLVSRVAAAGDSQPPVAPEPAAPPRSALRDLLLPVVTMVEGQGEDAWKPEPEAAPRPAATPQPFHPAAAVPPVAIFDSFSFLMSSLALAMLGAAGLEIVMCLAFLFRVVGIDPAFLLIRLFFSLFAVGQYVIATLVWLGWKKWDLRGAPQARARFLSRLRIAGIGYAGAFALSIILPAPLLLIVMTLAEGLVMLAAVEIIRLAYAVARERARAVAAATAAQGTFPT